MRNEIRVRERGGPVRGPSFYEQDFAKCVAPKWSRCAAGRIAALDRPNLIEELEGLTKRDERALGSQLKRIMAHMLNQRYQPPPPAAAGRLDRE